MGEMDEPSLGIPHVLAVHDHVVSGCERDTLPDLQVVLDEHGLGRTGQARWAVLNPCT